MEFTPRLEQIQKNVLCAATVDSPCWIDAVHARAMDCVKIARHGIHVSTLHLECLCFCCKNTTQNQNAKNMFANADTHNHTIVSCVYARKKTRIVLHKNNECRNRADASILTILGQPPVACTCVCVFLSCPHALSTTKMIPNAGNAFFPGMVSHNMNGHMQIIV